MRRLVTSIFVLSLILAFSCSKKNSDNPAGPNESPPLAPPLPSTNVPDNAPEQVRQLAHTVDASGMGGAAYMSVVFGTEAKKVGDIWAWNISVQGVNITVNATVHSDGSTYWQVVLSGTDGANTYANWVAVDGTVSADQKEANWNVYISGTQTVAATWTYNADNHGNSTSTYEAGVTKIVSVNNLDGSGSLSEYYDSNLKFGAEWDSSGSGTWSAYNDDGTTVDQGAWP